MKDFLPKDEVEGKEVTAEDLQGTVQSPQFKQVPIKYLVILISFFIFPYFKTFIGIFVL